MTFWTDQHDKKKQEQNMSDSQGLKVEKVEI